jgi:hypothetical protein
MALQARYRTRSAPYLCQIELHIFGDQIRVHSASSSPISACFLGSEDVERSWCFPGNCAKDSTTRPCAVHAHICCQKVGKRHSLLSSVPMLFRFNLFLAVLEYGQLYFRRILHSISKVRLLQIDVVSTELVVGESVLVHHSHLHVIVYT